MSETYQKVNKAIRFLNSLSGEWQLAYSGGKDSDALLYLARCSNIKFKPVYKNTTIDPPGTIKHVLMRGVEILRPNETFFHLIERKGLPTMFHRFCCSYLKEYYSAPNVLLGIRKFESVKRAKLYMEPLRCRLFSHKLCQQQAMPILEFTNDELAEFIQSEHIQCHPLYYDQDGNFHVERRLGCLGCPLRSDRGVSDYKRYPMFLRQVVKRFLKYCTNHPPAVDPYDILVKQLFYSNHGHNKFLQNYYGLFDRPDSRTLLEDYFQITLPEYTTPVSDSFHHLHSLPRIKPK